MLKSIGGFFMAFPYYSNYWANTLQNNYQPQNQNLPIRVILISNDDEVKAIPADHNGNPTFFYNKSGNKIYIKQVNPQTMEAHIQIFKAEPLQEVKTQPDEIIRYQTLLDGINGIYRLLAQQPEPEKEVKKDSKNAKQL